MLVPVSLFQSPSLFSFVETTNLPQDPVTLSATVSRMGFVLVSNRGFESVDDKEQTFALLSTFVQCSGVEPIYSNPLTNIKFLLSILIHFLHITWEISVFKLTLQ